jgi:hypothetical protein
MAIHERSECVARGPKAEPRASARETCEGSVGIDAAATHIDSLDACARPDYVAWISIHAIVYSYALRELWRRGSLLVVEPSISSSALTARFVSNRPVRAREWIPRSTIGRRGADSAKREEAHSPQMTRRGWIGTENDRSSRWLLVLGRARADLDALPMARAVRSAGRAAMPRSTMHASEA